MVKTEMNRERWLRVYAAVGALLTLAALPAVLWSSATVVEHPLNLALGATADGRARVIAAPGATGPAVVSEVRYSDGPWRPATRFDTLREGPGLPVGTRIAYRAEGPDGSGVVEGVVTRRPATREEQATTLAKAFPAGLLAMAALLFVVASSGARAMLASAALAGVAYVLGLSFLEANLTLVDSGAVRSALVILSRLFPFDLAYFLLFGLLDEFPSPLPPARWKHWTSALLFSVGVLRYVMTALGEVPGLLESRLPQSAQATWLGVGATLQFGLQAVVVLGLSILVRDQRRNYRRTQESASGRARASLAGWLLFIGIAPSLAALLVQAAGRIVTGRNLVPNVLMRLAFVPLFLVPLAVVWVSLSSEILPAKLLVRRAALFLLARRTARVGAFVPLAILVFFFWRHRDEPLSAILVAHPVVIGLAAAAVVVGLAWRESFQKAIERWLESSPPDADRIVSAVGDRARSAGSLDDLGAALSAELVKGFGVSDAALYVHEEGSSLYRAVGRDLPPIEADAPAVAALRTSRDGADLSKSGAAASTKASDRQARWAKATGLALLLPLSGSGGRLLGFLGVGPKRSEMAFEEGDRLALRAVAAAASLAVENLLLRSSGDAGPPSGPIERPVSSFVRASSDEIALWCPGCSRVFRATSGGLCEVDGNPLQTGDVPYVLAGRYLFERRLGAGGMGTVWGARDLTLGRSVAVKTLSRLSPGAAARFRREGRAAARFIHPNIATILTTETWRGVAVLVFEYLEGGTLAQRVKERPVAPGDAARWGALLAGALGAAHDGGVLHRDVKPSNIGFTADGTPKLLDFGLAAVFDDAEAHADPPGVVHGAADGLVLSVEKTVSRLTRSSAIVGTIPYLSPEAALGRTPTPDFDLWGLTLSLYEAVTGKNPFLAGSLAATLNRILSVPAPNARELRRDCPPALAAVLAHNLSPRLEERARSAAILRAEFQALSDRPGGAS
jgi:hypothetical protein